MISVTLSIITVGVSYYKDFVHPTDDWREGSADCRATQACPKRSPATSCLLNPVRRHAQRDAFPGF